MLAKFPDSKEADVIKKLPRLFGDVSVINEAKKLYNDEKSNEALDYLRRVYEKLCDMGLGDNITIDLGLVNRSNYYTGVIFRGYAEGSGLTIVSGGRYDNLLGEFGLDAPAIGFGVNVNALCDVMREEINVDRPIRIALTKGRLEKSSISLPSGALPVPPVKLLIPHAKAASIPLQKHLQKNLHRAISRSMRLPAV